MSEIDTMNKFLVSGAGRAEIAFLRPIPPRISADDALLLAAYLVSMADGTAAHSFDDVLKAVQST